MAVLVVSAAMGLAWAAVIALAVFAEKILPGDRIWRLAIAGALLGLGIASLLDEKEVTMAQMELKGTVLTACNCDYGCPCNFNAPPTQGKCEGHWTWHVEQGKVDDVALDGLTFSLCVDWPGAIHEGGGKGVALVDERADERSAAGRVPADRG